MRTRKHLITSMALAAGIAVAVPASAGASTSKVLLGNGRSIASAKGWGTVAPLGISSGSDPGARITQIHWQHWGRSTATGWGMTSIPKSTGGYYPGLYRVQLRASSIAWDASEHARAYMLLEAREPLKPGGALSPWFMWVGQQEMCN
jgi:hypothetical protein